MTRPPSPERQLLGARTPHHLGLGHLLLGAERRLHLLNPLGVQLGRLEGEQERRRAQVHLHDAAVALRPHHGVELALHRVLADVGVVLAVEQAPVLGEVELLVLVTVPAHIDRVAHGKAQPLELRRDALARHRRVLVAVAADGELVLRARLSRNCMPARHTPTATFRWFGAQLHQRHLVVVVGHALPRQLRRAPVAAEELGVRIEHQGRYGNLDEKRTFTGDSKSSVLGWECAAPAAAGARGSAPAGT